MKNRNVFSVYHLLSLVVVFLMLACQSSDPGTSAQEAGAPAGSATVLSPDELLPNGKVTEDGLLVGGQPSLENFEKIKAAGYKTIIDLRMPEEGGTSREDIEALGLAYERIPVAGAAGMTEDKARRLAEVLENAAPPVVIHCKSGNRVGGLLALKAFYVDGKTAEEAMEVGKKSGLRSLAPVLEEVMAAAPQQ